MIGESIGNFTFVSRLGRGGMGEVFAGEHVSMRTRVAIKILHAEISKDEEYVQRFFNEAKIVGRIKHSGIVKIFDSGMYNGHAYLIMELLEGEPLASRIANVGKLSWQDTVELGRQIAGVLDATHRAGIIHRDLKPDNIFLVQDHELATGERVKILDFGISKLSGTMASGSPKTVGTMGTPAYMAPEQWGDSGSVDWRADAYSLGCALFEMACGRPPFEVKTIADACAKHLHGVPPSPQQFAAMPDALAEVILRLLAKEPADRAVSMGQVTRELETIGGGRAYASSTEMPRAASSTLPRTPTPVPRTMAGDDASAPRTSGVGSLDPTVFPVAAATQTTLGTSAAQLEAAPRKKRKAWLGIVAGVVAVVAIVVGVVLARGGSKPEVEVAANPPPPAPVVNDPPATGSATRAVPPPPPVVEPKPTAKELVERGDSHFEATRYRDAETAYREAIALDPKLGSAHYGLGLAAGKLDDTKQAIDALTRYLEVAPNGRDAAAAKRSLETLRKQKPVASNGPKPPVTKPDAPSAKELIERATLLVGAGQLREAEVLYKKAIAAEPGNAKAHRNLGVVYARLGDTKKGAEAYRRYLVLAPNAPDAANVRALLDQHEGKKPEVAAPPESKTCPQVACATGLECKAGKCVKPPEVAKPPEQGSGSGGFGGRI